MTTSDEILIIANRLANQGKKPTVALIKSKLAHTVSLPLIINALKNWHHEPDFITLTSSAEKSDNEYSELTALAPLDQAAISSLITSEIEKALIPLHAEIVLLKQQIAKVSQ